MSYIVGVAVDSQSEPSGLENAREKDVPKIKVLAHIDAQERRHHSILFGALTTTHD